MALAIKSECLDCAEHTVDDPFDPEEYVPTPCSIHDDRLRSLETAMAAQSAQLQAGTDTFRAVQESIKNLSEGMRDSFNRVERKMEKVGDDVESLASKLGEVQVKQATHEAQLQAVITQQTNETALRATEVQAALEEKREEKRDNKRFWMDAARRGALVVAIAVASAIAGALGHSGLAAIIKLIAGG
jgi:hypothetical protein